jgi:sulfhydrogenase subunit alpha
MYCFERIPQLVDEILKLAEDVPLVEYAVNEGNGTGLVEAPRGLLIHHYEIKDGLVENVDIVTPTAQNAEDIERYCHIAAQKLLDDGKEDEIRDRLDLVVRAFDPCISCSAHLAKVKHAPRENWKEKLDKIRSKKNPVFVGVGNPSRSDDALGIDLAQKMQDNGINNVWVATEPDLHDIPVNSQNSHPVIFLDATDFQEAPGKITLLPLEYVFRNVSLSHRIAPFIQVLKSNEQLKGAYLLGIQPASVEEEGDISPAVREAIDKILEHLEN